MDEPELKIIDVFICKVRKKLSRACANENCIETIWGRGYVLKDPKPSQNEAVALAVGASANLRFVSGPRFQATLSQNQ